MRILITNNTLARRAGSELYVRDLALGLIKRGHTVFAYSTNLGDVARELQSAGIEVVNNLDQLEFEPNIIHGHHHLDTMTALLRFPHVPAIFVCHGSNPWEETPPVFPRILRYVAVDLPCRDRILAEGIAETNIRMFYNFVDLERFKARDELPKRPQRALVFSNQANEGTYVGPVRTACTRARLALDVIGACAQNVSLAPESVLGGYDIVFAKGRSALESLAVGAAVILCDASGMGPMVTTTNVKELRPLNFGLRCLTHPITCAAISREIASYDPTDAALVSDFTRKTAGADAVFDRFVSLYKEVIDQHRNQYRRNPTAEDRAAAAYLRGLVPRFHKLDASQDELKMVSNSRSWRLFSRYTEIRDLFIFTMCGRLARLLRRQTR